MRRSILVSLGLALTTAGTLAAQAPGKGSVDLGLFGRYAMYPDALYEPADPGMGGGAETDDRPSAIQIVGDVLHLIVRKILEPQEDHQQVGRLQGLESRDVRAARLDEAGLWIGRNEDTALESVVLREHPRQGRQRFFRAIFMVARQKHDVLTVAGALVALVHDDVWILGAGDGGRGQERDEGEEEREMFGHRMSTKEETETTVFTTKEPKTNEEISRRDRRERDEDSRQADTGVRR